MRRALELAREAAAAGEVPIGAVLTLPDGEAFEGRNRSEEGSPLDHAEMAALAAALAARGRRGLNGATLTVTAEPCLMCLGACVQARIGGLVYACEEPRFGGVATLQTLWKEGRYPHRFPIAKAGAALEEEARGLMKAFFEGLRRKEDG
jgi:tRNA(adenine34) deaminase